MTQIDFLHAVFFNDTNFSFNKRTMSNKCGWLRKFFDRMNRLISPPQISLPAHLMPFSLSRWCDYADISPWISLIYLVPVNINPNFVFNKAENIFCSKHFFWWHIQIGYTAKMLLLDYLNQHAIENKSLNFDLTLVSCCGQGQQKLLPWTVINLQLR